MKLGVDVSWWNDDVDFDLLKNNKVEFVIIRAGYGRRVDENFTRNAAKASAAGLKIGAYWYSYALDEYDAEEEGYLCKDVIKDSGLLLELPIFFDMEDDDYKYKHKFIYNTYHITAICRAFLDAIKPLRGGIYSNLNWLSKYIDVNACPNTAVWCAQYHSSCDMPCNIWQYTDKLLIGEDFFDGNFLFD